MEISEHSEQVAIFAWVDLNLGLYPALVNLFAIPNGGQRDRCTGKMLKREGVKSGVPDMFLAYPSMGYHGLFIELKRRGGGVASFNQSDWLERLGGAGYKAIIAYGAKEAVNEILKYLDLP